jgi:hypothetical protein
MLRVCLGAIFTKYSKNIVVSENVITVNTFMCLALPKTAALYTKLSTMLQFLTFWKKKGQDLFFKK